jgi:hypothetical protein
MEAARCMRLEACAPKAFWVEAAHAAVHTINRQPCTSLDGDTPYHRLLGRHGSLSHVRVWGCRAYVHVAPNVQMDKMAVHTFSGVLATTSSNTAAIVSSTPAASRCVRQAVHVTFDEACCQQGAVGAWRTTTSTSQPLLSWRPGGNRWARSSRCLSLEEWEKLPLRQLEQLM